MKIVDYTPSIETLSWLRQAGVNIAPLVTLRRNPLLNMSSKGAVPRVNPMAAFRLVRPIPSYNPNFSASFEQVMDATAASLLAENKHIRLSWSGGLDSTGALLALKKAGAVRGQITVYYTAASVAEYPALLSFIEQNFESLLVQAIIPDMSGDSLWVNGEGGNQIFFPVSAGKFAAMRTKFSTPANEWPWEQFFLFTHPDWRTADVPDRFDAHKVGAAEEQIARTLMGACPFPIVTTEQAQWWRTFALHWQHLYLRQGMPLGQADFVAFGNRVRPFFMTPAWQRWSMKYMANKQPDTSYLWLKKPLKDYIHSVYPDPAYYDTKATGASSTGVVYSGAPYVRFEDGSVAVSEADCIAKVAA